MSAYEKAAKKFIVVSNTEQELFHKILSNQVEGTPDILFLRAKDFKKSSIAGDLLSSDEARNRITKYLENKSEVPTAPLLSEP